MRFFVNLKLTVPFWFLIKFLKNMSLQRSFSRVVHIFSEQLVLFQAAKAGHFHERTELTL